MRPFTIALAVCALVATTFAIGCQKSSEDVIADGSLKNDSVNDKSTAGAAAPLGNEEAGGYARNESDETAIKDLGYTASANRPVEAETADESNDDSELASPVAADPTLSAEPVSPAAKSAPGPSSGKLASRETLHKYEHKGADGQVHDNRRQLPQRQIAQPLALEQTPRANHEGIGPGFSGDQYASINDNPFRQVTDHPLSTFSIDVDTAAYANTRRFLFENNMLPPAGVVRVEELINYFNYDYAPPTEVDTPFATHVEVADCPWQPEHRLVRVGIKGQEIDNDQRPASNLVFLLDVSGSMQSSDKLPLLKSGMLKLVDQLGENDRVAIVVYAGASGLVLPSTPATNKAAIREAIERLRSGGSTAGAAGIQLAYKVALENYIKGGTNRVLLGTDGDFNVGVSNTAELVKLVEAKAKTGVFLSVFGFGRGNLNDAMMEEISNKGNGNYAYIDTEKEAAKVLVEQTGGTLVTIAKDVKIQIEFNPAQVASYRLVGYANRMLKKEDFNDDKKDAGEIGAGHTVTALYEIVPAGSEVAAASAKAPAVDELKFQSPRTLSDAADSGQLLLLKIRYKQPDGEVSRLLTFDVKDEGRSFNASSRDFKFASAVAAFGMLLRNSEHQGDANYQAVEEIAATSKGDDPHGYRAEFVELVRRAKEITARTARAGE